jgi:hypothetical protein
VHRGNQTGFGGVALGFRTLSSCHIVEDDAEARTAERKCTQVDPALRPGRIAFDMVWLAGAHDLGKKTKPFGIAAGRELGRKVPDHNVARQTGMHLKGGLVSNDIAAAHKVPDRSVRPDPAHLCVETVPR